MRDELYPPTPDLPLGSVFAVRHIPWEHQLYLRLFITNGGGS